MMTLCRDEEGEESWITNVSHPTWHKIETLRGWVGSWPDGRDYYDTLSNMFQSLKSNQQFWDNLNEHWVRYESEVLNEDLIREAKNEKEVVLDVGDYAEENIR